LRAFLFLVYIKGWVKLAEWIPMPISLFTQFHPNVGRWYEVLNRPVCFMQLLF
jgi:hypothetical protein